MCQICSSVVSTETQSLEGLGLSESLLLELSEFLLSLSLDLESWTFTPLLIIGASSRPDTFSLKGIHLERSL